MATKKTGKKDAPKRSKKKTTSPKAAPKRGGKSASGGGRAASLDYANGPTPLPPPPGDTDPPIIIQGGSVKISSSVFLTASMSGGRYIYETSAVTIGKIKTRGKKDQEDDTDGGKFTIQLF
jgi:hypothetical protein